MYFYIKNSVFTEGVLLLNSRHKKSDECYLVAQTNIL